MLRKLEIPESPNASANAVKRRKYVSESEVGANNSNPVVEQELAVHEGHSAFGDSEWGLDEVAKLSMPLFSNLNPVSFDIGQNKKSSSSQQSRVESGEDDAHQGAFDVGAFLVGSDEDRDSNELTESPPELRHMQSPLPRRNRTLEAAAVTPVKFHIGLKEIAPKEEGVNKSGYVLETASGKTFMFKPECGKLTWSFWEMVNEIVAGNLYRLYLGKSRAPVIGVCTSQLRGVMQLGIASEMFEFTQLFKTEWKTVKPVDFEKIIVTSAFLGDPDPHNRNVGYNGAGELSKLDHGRAFLAGYINGLDFLDYLTRMCRYNYYNYMLSITAIEQQLIEIQSVGVDLPRKIIVDAFACIEEHASQELMPCKIKSYKKGRWVDPDARNEDFRCYHMGMASVSSWRAYNADIISFFDSNYSVIADALGILTNMRIQGYEVIMIAKNSSASVPDADPKVCSDFQKYAAAIKAERDKTNQPNKVNIWSFLDFYRDNDEHKGR